MDRKAKEPFNMMAASDKSRYDRELTQFAQSSVNQNLIMEMNSPESNHYSLENQVHI